MAIEQLRPTTVPPQPKPVRASAIPPECDWPWRSAVTAVVITGKRIEWQFDGDES